MKIYLQILELNFRHEFSHSFATAWTNQTRAIYKIDRKQSSATIETMCNVNQPLALVIGAYGVRKLDGEDIYHPCGSCVVDMSKVDMDTISTFVTDLTDQSSPQPVVGKIHFNIKWKPVLLPPAMPNLKNIGRKMHGAAERNLTFIAPWGSRGLQPTDPNLTRVHSPYYNSNIGITMPSGAFTLELGTTHPSKPCQQSHVHRLLSTMKCCGLKRNSFIKYAAMIKQGEVDGETKNALIVMAKTLTMHTNQVMKYVSDIQFDGAKTVPTDRWECPRDMDAQFVGDCEDCAKEIMVEIHEWQHMDPTDEVVSAVQDILSCYVPVICQGAVAINGNPQNHIWAALIPDATFIASLGRVAKFESTAPVQERCLPTILLEGTSATHPLYTPLDAVDRMHKKRDRLMQMEPIFSNTEMYDIERTHFYKHVVACMTPKWKEKGMLDYIYLNKSMRHNDVTYGIPFDKWVRGYYKMIPAAQHSAEGIRMMEHVCSYDKPITPLKYNTQIIASMGEPVRNMWENNLMFGYRTKHRHDGFHNAVCDAVERLKRQGWKIYGNIIDHETCYWMEWVVELPKHEKGKSPGLIML